MRFLGLITVLFVGIGLGSLHSSQVIPEAKANTFTPAPGDVAVLLNTPSLKCYSLPTNRWVITCAGYDTKGDVTDVEMQMSQ